MKIAYVAPRYAPSIGGVEVHVARLASRMAALGHEVEVLAQEPNGALPPVEVMDGVTVRRFPLLLPSAAYALAPALWAHLRQHGPGYHVVHAHGYHALPALGAALSPCQSLVFTPHYHGGGHTPVRRLLHHPYRVAGRHILRRARHIICVSRAEAGLVRAHFPPAAGRLRVIPNGVDTEGLRQARPYPGAGTVFLCVGWLECYKNVGLAVRALALIDAPATLCVIGDGPQGLALRRLAARLGLRDRVRFLGHVSEQDLWRWYRTASVLIALSRHEAFGLTLREALAAGTAVVASDIPAHRAHRDLEHPGGYAPDALRLLSPDVAPDIVAAALRDLARAWNTCARAPRVLPGILSWDDVAARTAALYQGYL